jgi:hypothetical protein
LSSLVCLRASMELEEEEEELKKKKKKYITN